MRAFTTTMVALSASAAAALDAVVAPSSLVAEQNFPLLYSNQDAATKYRVYLAATLSDISGPTCYLINSTNLPDSGLSLSIPADIGPDANYYSIAISPLASNGTSSDDAAAISYSQPISITGLTASYTTYETSLRGAPFWDADLLPCGSYACARKCADEEFPEGTEVGKDGQESYARMVECFEECDGIVVEPEKGSEEGSATVTASASTRATTAAMTTTSDSAASATEETAAATSSDAAALQQISGTIVVAGVVGAMAMLD